MTIIYSELFNQTIKLSENDEPTESEIPFESESSSENDESSERPDLGTSLETHSNDPDSTEKRDIP